MLQVIELKKSFGGKPVVKGVSFSVDKGEAFGLLGPNGAGKSTTISMICGLLKIDGGDVRVNGLSIKKDPMAVKRKIGIVPQDIALYPTMTAKENLVFWGKMYGLKGREAKAKADRVLADVGLSDRANDKIETFSGGMKRRINIGAALMHDPELLIMDEPTVGIDPQSRNHILETVKRLNEQGMTVIYTSHYMEEVEFLCERIAIIDHGEVIALGTKTELCNRLAGGTVIQLKVDPIKERFIQRLKTMEAVANVKIVEEDRIEVFVTRADAALSQIVALSLEHRVQLLSLNVKEPNLEALFLQLTGRSLRD
nr:ABC transporter ATP-binding protein [Caenibacillus caldisaponilyticus]